MSAITLPVSTVKPIDHSRVQLVTQLEKYLAFKRAKMTNQRDKDNCVLPFSSEYGLCAGIAAYWAYMKRTGAEGKFIHQLEYLLEWKPHTMPPGSTEDPTIETIFNAIAFLQFDSQLRTDIHEFDVHNSFKLFLSDMHEQVADPELTFTFVFTMETMANFVREYFQANKMIRISSLHHTMFAIKSGDVYHLYDPESDAGPKQYDNPGPLSRALIDALQTDNDDSNDVAINISVFDLEGVEHAPYPNLDQFVANTFLHQSHYKQLVSNNPEIFDLAIRHKDLTRLIEHNLFKDYRNGSKDTPLEIAIRKNRYPEMLELLLAGANPQEAISDGASLWLYAVTNKKTAAIILLLAFEIKIDPKEFSHLANCYSKHDIASITENAIALNKQLLDLDRFDLSTASGHNIVSFLRNSQLKIQLGHSISEIKIHSHGKLLQGKIALAEIARYFRDTKNLNMYSCAQKTEIYTLLKFFKGNKFKFHGSKELLKIINKAVTEIRKIANPTLNDLMEIAVILDELQELSSQPMRINPKKMYVRHKATAAERSIQKHLIEKLGINSITDHIAQVRQQQHMQPRNYLFFTPDSLTEPDIAYDDIAPFLSLRT